jgi:DNA-directed RNA polymerase specialized sigma24 family protein
MLDAKSTSTSNELRRRKRHNSCWCSRTHNKHDAAIDERSSRVVELRFFGGMSVEETAEALGVAPVTVKRDWSTAKAWLYRTMKT